MPEKVHVSTVILKKNLMIVTAASYVKKKTPPRPEGKGTAPSQPGLELSPVHSPESMFCSVPWVGHTVHFRLVVIGP